MDRVDIYKSLAAHTNEKGKFFKYLRTLPIDVVGDLMLNVPEHHEDLRRILPRMAPDEIQRNWNGSSGYDLLLQSCAFMRTLECGVNRFSGRSLDNAKILDFGCGWGRLLRLLYKFTAPENIYGCDPWDQSLQICADCGITGNLAQSDYLPENLPFPGMKFDFIYAYSVFTHLSEKAALAAVSACRKHIADDGLLIITVRPKSYWEVHPDSQNHLVVKSQMIKDHERKGFAFTPHGVGTPAQVNGEITYGDSSMTLDYIKDHWREWQVVGTEHFLQDPYQMLVFLKPK
ncbi:methyltransferase domain-containing protein [Pseudomonas sp. LRP2-20]|uniref:class I SAM-dependent methyltransferase n=1 Tax=Pseudomonas sp. LRP2-20 TaxID=2944234 RepID=UPI00218A4216|nr:class I SAM-dependent methyltransferase [Pseudomonas sp. LRP2-20]BDM24254.1 methyltransferase domain-containing protein [Pseudomonas sp. LRP2-20]